MSADYLYQLMSSQRAIRRLRPDPIPEDVLQRIKQAAAWAPSGGNQQPWRMIMVHDRVRKARLGELYERRWSAYIGHYRARLAGASEERLRKEERTIAAGDHLAANMGEIPVLAVVCFNPEMMAVTDADQGRVSVVGGGSVYLAVQNLMLACQAEGVGCVLTTLLCMDEPAVREILHIDPHWYTAAFVPMGYPAAGGYGPTRRHPVEKMFYKDAWGAQ